MGKDNKNIGLFGETAVALELIKLGYDVININSSIQNYKNADLIVMNSKTGKSTMVQVKCGTTHNIFVGFVSELDGTIPIDEKIICAHGCLLKLTTITTQNSMFYRLMKQRH